MGGGIKRSETKGDNPAQHKLDEDIIYRQRISAESEHVEDRGDNTDAILEPKRNGSKDQEDGKVNHRPAGHHQHEPQIIG